MFHQDLILRPHRDKPGGKLTQALVWEHKRFGVFTVPEGFDTDFASVPRALWLLCPPWGRYQEAAVLHDYLYHSQTVTRAEADRIFLLVMIEDGTKVWRAYAMYYAVRIFGGFAWKKISKETA